MKGKKILKILGDNVKSTRLKRGLSQDNLAEKAELHRTYIGGIERGERNVSILNIERIAKALNVKIDDLVG